MRTMVIRWDGESQVLVRKVGRAAIRTGRRTDATAMYEGSSQPSDETTVHRWTVGGGWVAEARLVFDRQARCTYLTLQSPRPEVEAQVFAWFSERLQAVPLAELLDDAARNGDHDDQAYVRLALGAGSEPSEEVRRLLAGSLRAPEPTRRRGAALAVGLLQWPRLLHDVASALETETDEGTRAVLTVAYRQMNA
ncbi:MAG TPA: hypothetical protein VFT45_15410 [Longimicrobium sp.]|nr:hypothetical protein [Longimicrobium sp.]